MQSRSPQTPPPTTVPRPGSPSPSLPFLSEDDKERIDTWFDHDSRLPEIAKELNTNVLELAAWADQPHIKQALAFVKRIARERTETLQAEADHQSISRLLSLSRYSENEETARRACINLLMWHRVLHPHSPRRPVPAAKPDPASTPCPAQPTSQSPSDFAPPTLQLPALRLPSMPPIPTGQLRHTPHKPTNDATASQLDPSAPKTTSAAPAHSSTTTRTDPQPHISEPPTFSPRTTLTPRPAPTIAPWHNPCLQPRPPDH